MKISKLVLVSNVSLNLSLYKEQNICQFNTILLWFTTVQPVEIDALPTSFQFVLNPLQVLDLQKFFEKEISINTIHISTIEKPSNLSLYFANNKTIDNFLTPDSIASSIFLDSIGTSQFIKPHHLYFNIRAMYD